MGDRYAYMKSYPAKLIIYKALILNLLFKIKNFNNDNLAKLNLMTPS